MNAPSNQTTEPKRLWRCVNCKTRWIDAHECPRCTAGLWNRLTPEQQRLVLDYDGPENHGPEEFSNDPRNQTTERHAYDAGWNNALAAVRSIVPKLQTYDENGYITKWADLLHALGELQRNG